MNRRKRVQYTLSFEQHAAAQEIATRLGYTSVSDWAKVAQVREITAEQRAVRWDGRRPTLTPEEDPEERGLSDEDTAPLIPRRVLDTIPPDPEEP